MKNKIILILIITVFSITCARAQNDWKSYRIDNKLSVRLPAEPQRKDENNLVATVRDSSMYFITIMDLHIDTARVSDMLNQPNFANGIKDAMLKSTPGFTVGDMKRGNWKGYTIFHADGVDSTTHFKLSFNMLAIGSTLYFLGNMIPEKKIGKVNFLDLLTLN